MFRRTSVRRQSVRLSTNVGKARVLEQEENEGNGTQYGKIEL